MESILNVLKVAKDHVKMARLNLALSTIENIFKYRKKELKGFGAWKHYEKRFSLIYSRCSRLSSKVAVTQAKDEAIEWARLTNDILDFIDTFEDEWADHTSSVVSNAAEERKQDKIKTKKISIKLDTDFDSFTEEDKRKFLKGLASMLSMEVGDIKITKIKKGSVILNLELPEEKAEYLVEVIMMTWNRELSINGIPVSIHGPGLEKKDEAPIIPRPDLKPQGIEVVGDEFKIENEADIESIRAIFDPFLKPTISEEEIKEILSGLEQIIIEPSPDSRLDIDDIQARISRSKKNTIKRLKRFLEDRRINSKDEKLKPK